MVLDAWTLEMEEKAYRAAREQNAAYDDLPRNELMRIIRSSLTEIQALESAAQVRKIKDIPSEVIAKIAAVWVFSGPDTYSGSPSPRYEKYPWTWDMDRARVAHGLDLAEASPNATFMYNGSDLQNSFLREHSPWAAHHLSQDRISIFGENLVNTVDQIKTFNMPQELHTPNHAIAFVSHAPHLMRVMHILNHFRTTPDDMKIYAVPLASPDRHSDEYALQEVCGLLYYTFIAKERAGSPEAYPYMIV